MVKKYYSQLSQKGKTILPRDLITRFDLHEGDILSVKPHKKNSVILEKQ